MMREILENYDAAPEEGEPQKKAKNLSRKPLPKKFYKHATFQKNDDGYIILLDGRNVKTPARRDLVLPTQEMAQLIVQEFNAQIEVIDPSTMPLTRMANTVVDGIADDMQPVFEDLLRFVATDLLFYRASTPKELVERQNNAWDPYIDWAALKLGARFLLGEGVMHVEQPKEAIQAVSNYLRRVESPFVLAALHTMTTLTGSTLLALAVADGEAGVNEIWNIAHLDEDWTDEHWGEDSEAKARRQYRKAEFDAAAAIMVACR